MAQNNSHLEPPAIRCAGLTKRFAGHIAVDNLSFQVNAGSLCAFLGPNGAGKSTTLKMLTGLLAPSAGDLAICGIDVRTRFAEIQPRIGVMPEGLALFEHLTVEEHLLLTADVYGVPRRVADRRVSQLLRVLSLDHGRERYVSECSHGMKKKTAFAMALLPNPEVLFLDEPFEAIDPVTSRLMHQLLVSACSRGVTVFVTSHILPAIEKIAQRFFIIADGRIVHDSDVDASNLPLEELYCRLVASPALEPLEWLRCDRS